MKVFLPIHLDSGNRGCEAITRATAEMLGLPSEDFIALSRDVQLDTRLQLDKIATLVPEKKFPLIRRFQRKFLYMFSTDKWKAMELTCQHSYIPFLNQMSQEDVMVSTGGDMMCYEDNQVIYTNNWAHARGIKTVLWGCSIGENNLTPKKKETLCNFSLIYARESLTADMLKKQGISNVVTFPDPAFVLKPEQCELPSVFAGEVVGLNFSNYIVGSDNLDTKFGAEVVELIQYILSETKLNILLIPHVFWRGQDDRLIANVILQHFNSNHRIQVLDSDRLNYCQLRYVISRCRFFVGARTHAAISAYSTCVPTLALGYSIKSKGIAKDLGLSEKLILDSKSFQKGDLLKSFVYMQNTEEQIKAHLNSIMPEYINRLGGVKNLIL